MLLVALRCHRAWLRVAPHADAREDVLALDGVKLVVHAGARDGVDVLISGDAPTLVTEIERRARVAIARAQRLRAITDERPHTRRLATASIAFRPVPNRAIASRLRSSSPYGR